MQEHYGVQIKNLSERIHLLGGDKHSFFYHKKDFRVLGPDDSVMVTELEHVIRVNTGLVKQRDLKYITVLGNSEFQFLFISNGVNTRVVLYNIVHQQGMNVLLDTGVSEPILALTDFINKAESKVIDITSPWVYIRGYAAKLLAQHCTPGKPSIVLNIYREGY